ncbi:ABC transporter permease [Listeria ivanovii]|uniref:ABC transporter permease n=2 Tax=Listeria ivanovii TaxID=1638 RepID=A0ABS1G5S6_LISIV|nr:ABC transporter permease [Listeria ivanovii]AIS60519.1 ABC transporter permease [Listeria ivanovii subsp. londoniensis]AIS63348.1 ABC transporter permease [Listeria ivanovii subsp. londoniensis]MBK1962095.1 ABC transporter permease [Listeria ivanovii subsp. londoniensis]MBK1966417.1 ABC transporter permease [Listeria ivanovii subsp. londoniensis]MBK1983626.1 ABC transporter permease [Listeria ivanovii subsp. londoniensis]
MTLFDLAKKNIRHNFVHYFLYFASMIFSIMIYFTFLVLSKDPAVVERIDKSTKLSTAFSTSSVILLIFVAIFILYSNNFFTRKRKKEIGLYSLLGLRKKEIGRMLFYENFLMGLGALVIGILAGTLLSKIFVTILLNLINIGNIGGFAFSWEAVIQTSIVFLIITLFTSFSGYRIIYRTTLLDLFHSEAKREKSPKPSLILALLSLIFIALGYTIAGQPLESKGSIWVKLGLPIGSLVILASVIVGTALFITFFLPYLLAKLRKNKKLFYKGSNIISTSQLTFRISSNAKTLIVISILSATTLSVIGTISSIYYQANKSASTTAPSSFEYVIPKDASNNEKIIQTAGSDPEHPIEYQQESTYYIVPAKESNPDFIEYNINEGFPVISESNYNTLVKKQGNNEKAANLKENQAQMVLSFMYDERSKKEMIGEKYTLMTAGNPTVQIKSVVQDSPLGTVQGLLVLPDSQIKKIASDKHNKPVKLESISVQNAKKAQELAGKVQAVTPKDSMLLSYSTTYQGIITITGVLLFIGMFIGFVFLAATGSIIYFKQLTEAYNDIGTFDILQKIGLNRKDIRKTLAKQLLVVFLIPLVIGILHSSFALVGLSHMLGLDLTMPVIISTGIYTLMYIVYYFLTLNSYTNIVVGKKQ